MTTDSSANILLSFFPLIENGLVQIISRLDPNSFDVPDQNLFNRFRDKYPRSIAGYTKTVDIFVSYAQKSPEPSIRFLISLLPFDYGNDDTDKDTSLYTRITNDIQKAKINNPCSQKLIDLFLVLFFADCTAQTLSADPHVSIYNELISIANSILKPIENSDDNLDLVQKMIISQFSVILSFVSIDHVTDVVENLYSLLDTYDVNQVLLLNTYIRLTKLDIDSISKLLEQLLNMEITSQWADAMQPIVMQLSIETFPSLNKLLVNIMKKIENRVYPAAKSKKKSSTSESTQDNNADSFIKLYAICMIRQESNVQKLTAFIENVICARIDDSTFGCLAAYLNFLRGPFVSKANLFWEWGTNNKMGHPGIEVTHISVLDTKKMAKTFSTLCDNKKVYKYPKLIGNILVQFAGRNFLYFCGEIIPAYVSKMKTHQNAFKSLNICLNKIVEPELRFAEWAQENPDNQDKNVSEMIPILFLQLKTVLYMQAQEYNLEESSKFAFNFHLVDSVNFPELNLPVQQENIAPEFRSTVEKWYKHQQQILDTIDIFDDDSSQEETRHYKDDESEDNQESQDSEGPNSYFDVKIRPQKRETLDEKEQLYINILSFFPRIMNKSDFLSSVGNQLFNSMVSECPAVALYSIMIINHLFNAKPEDRLDIMDALMEKTVKTTNKEFLFVFLSFLIKLFDLSLSPKSPNTETIYEFIQKAEAFCVFMMANDSPVIQCLANALAQRIDRFARGMQTESNLYNLITTYEHEIEQNIIKKVKLNMIVTKERSKFMSQMRLVEILNLMNLKSTVEFFKHLQAFVLPCITTSTQNYHDILLSYSVRYLDSGLVSNIRKYLESENNFNAKFDTPQKDREEEDLECQDAPKNYLSSFYPIYIFMVNYSDEAAESLQSSYITNYLISNASSLTSVHWTTAILLLNDLCDELNGLDENSITAQDIKNWVSIFSVIMKSADIKFALISNEKVQQAVMKFVDIYINFYRKENNATQLNSFSDFCTIITTYFNSFIIQNTSYCEGPFRKPSPSLLASKINSDHDQNAKLVDLFDTLICYSSQLIYFRYASRAFSSMLQVLPILDENEDYIKGKVLTVQDPTLLDGKSEEEIYQSSKQDILTLLSQTLNDSNLYSKLSMNRNGINIYNALCCNPETLLPLLLEDVFLCPFFFIPLYQFFVGDNVDTTNLEEADVKFNQFIIEKFSGRILFIALFFMMSNLSSIRMKAMNLLKRVSSLFLLTLYEDQDAYKRMSGRFKRYEPSFLLFSTDYEVPPISLISKFAQLVIISFPSLNDDIINSAIDCLNSVKMLNNEQSNIGVDNYYDLNYYKNQEIYYMPSKSELQTNVLQLMSTFLRSYSLKSDSNKYTPYMLVRKLLTVCDPSEPNTVTHFYSLFDQLCNENRQLIEQVIDYLLDPNYVSNQKDDFNNIKSLLVHFSTDNIELLLRLLSLRLSYSYYYAVTVPMYKDNESPDLSNFYLYYEPIVSALHTIVLNAPAKTSDDKSILDIFSKFLPKIIVFCLIFYNKTSSSLLMSLLNKMDCPEEVMRLGRNQHYASQNDITQSSQLIPIDEDESYMNEVEESESESFTVFSSLPERFVPALLNYLKGNSNYGRDFINEIGTECLRWCNGCGDLHVAGRACIVFSQILKPLDTDVFESFYRTMSYVISIPNIFTSSSLQGKTSTAQEYLTGLFTLFNAIVEVYKDKKNFADTFKVFYSIISPFSSIPYFNTQKTKSESGRHKHSNQELEDSNSSFLVSDVNNYYELSNQITTFISKSILYNIFDLEKSNQELITLLPGIACNSVTMRPRKSVDALLLSVFNPNRAHNIEHAGEEEDEAGDKKTEMISLVTFLAYFPWLYSAFAAYHNIEPFSSLFTDSEIPIILQLGLLMGMGIQLPDALCTYLLAALKEPSKASVDDFPLQVGITIAKASPQGIIAAAPVLIEMAQFAGSKILKIKSKLQHEKKDNKKKQEGEEAQNDDDYESENDDTENISIFENQNNSIAFLLSIVTIVRCFLEYADFTDGVDAFAPLIPIATNALEAYEDGKDDDYKISYPTANSSGLNSVSLEYAKNKLREELSKLVANLLSLSRSRDKKEGQEEAAEVSQKDETKSSVLFTPKDIENVTWSSVSEGIIAHLRQEKLVHQKRLFPAIKVPPGETYYETDLSDPIIAIPFDKNVWNTQEVENARQQVSNIKVKGITKKLMIIEAARLAKPSKKKDDDKAGPVTAKIPVKYSTYQKFEII